MCLGSLAVKQKKFKEVHNNIEMNCLARAWVWDLLGQLSNWNDLLFKLNPADNFIFFQRIFAHFLFWPNLKCGRWRLFFSIYDGAFYVDLQFVLLSLLFWGKSCRLFGHSLIFIYSYWNKNMSHFFRSATLLRMDKYKCQEYEHRSNFQTASESQKWYLLRKKSSSATGHDLIPWLGESGSGFDWGVRNVTGEVRRDGYHPSQPFDISQLKWLMETQFWTMGPYFDPLKEANDKILLILYSTVQYSKPHSSWHIPVLWSHVIT